jgi:hypothetical protein
MWEWEEASGKETPRVWVWPEGREAKWGGA